MRGELVIQQHMTTQSIGFTRLWQILPTFSKFLQDYNYAVVGTRDWQNLPTFPKFSQDYNSAGDRY